MKRRHFLVSLLTLSLMKLNAVNFREEKPEAWIKSNLNSAAAALYGDKKFAAIKESTKVELIAAKSIVRDPEQIPIQIKSKIKAKSVAIFQDANPQSLVTVFTVEEDGIIDYELNIKMEIKGTLFVVVEGIDGVLYYARQFIDVVHLRCSGAQ